MPCRVDLFRCSHCGGEHYYHDECLNNPSKYREGLSGYDLKTATAEQKVVKKKKSKTLDVEGALCDVLTLLEDKKSLTLTDIPQDILSWWNVHQSREREKIKREALAKLSPRERRALGLK